MLGKQLSGGEAESLSQEAVEAFPLHLTEAPSGIRASLLFARRLGRLVMTAGNSSLLPFAAAGTAICMTLTGVAGAQTPIENSALPAAEQANQAEPPAPESPSISSSSPALGDVKKALLDRGLNLQVNYIGEVFGNPTGGVRQGALYEHRIELGLDADLNQIAGLKGLTFHVNSYAIAGSSLSTFNILNLSAISNIAARPALLLFELWVEQRLFDDKVAVRVGQLAADSEFLISDLGSLFTNGTFGFPNILDFDLPSGGPAYPFATPAVRIKFNPTDQLTLMAGVFDGDPTGAGFTGAQAVLDPSGVNFRLRDPPLVIAEAQYAYNQSKNSQGPAGTLKFGGWYHFGNFNDVHFRADGLSLADPASNGAALTHGGDYGLYGIIDQMLWRLPGDDPKKGIGVFGRVSASPSDRDLISFYADGGIDFIGLWSQRAGDSFGIGVAYSEISQAARAFDLDKAFFSGATLPARNYEIALELTYQAQILPGWTVQPDFQYIFHPGGGTVNPVDAVSGRVPDAAVFGLRTTVKF
jgi:porin